MNETPIYNFSHISDIVRAITGLYASDKEPTADELRLLKAAITGFYETRTICELFEIYDWTDEANQLSIFDYQDLLLRPFEKEMEQRTFWHSQDYVDAMNLLLPSWSANESLKVRFDGLQKKVDRIAHLLEKFEIKMSVKDALELSK